MLIYSKYNIYNIVFAASCLFLLCLSIITDAMHILYRGYLLWIL